MTIFRPLGTGVLGTERTGGMLEHRHPEFQNPQEGAMSPDQFEQLKNILLEMEDRLGARAEYETLSATLNKRADELEKANADLASRLQAAENRGTELSTSLAETQSVLSKANSDLVALQAEVEKRDGKIADLRAGLVEAQEELAKAYKALKAAKAAKPEPEEAKPDDDHASQPKKKDKSGGAH